MNLSGWLLPATDAGVAAQVLGVTAAWIVAFAATWHRDRDIRVFVTGLGFLLLALMAARAVVH